MLPNQRHFFGFFTGVGEAWPFGLDGDLYIPNATTVTLNPGDIKDYNSITIDVGGVLQVSAGSAWTIIGCKGDCDVSGIIRGINGEHTGGTFATTAPDDEPLSYTLVQKNGGAGGAGTGSVGGAQAYGNGGGGGGDNDGETAIISKGGNGGSIEGGIGADVYGNIGGNGIVAGGDYGAGGGGGSRGGHGQGLYMKIVGIYSGAGDINVYGGSAGAGGGGAADKYGGGGGGGAAGGSGGKIHIRYSASTFSGSYDTSGGSAGSGGGGGVGGNINGAPGSAGEAGNAGSTDVGAY